MKKQNGVTLIALVITIIVLLILAGVSINVFLGERNVFELAATSGEKYNISEYVDKVELARTEVELQNEGHDYLEELIKQIYKEEIVANGSIKQLSDTKAKMTTKEGWVFIITGASKDGKPDEDGNGTKYIGKTDDVPTPPDIKEGMIEYTLTPTGWTNTDVKLGMKLNIEGKYTIQYSYDEKNWLDYKKEIVFKENGSIDVRIRNDIGEVPQNGYATYKVTTIDKLNPLNFEPIITKTSNTLTIDASGAKDAEANEKYGKSEIKEIWYSNDDGISWKTNEDKSSTTYTFTNLTQGTLYKIKVKAIDNAGNEIITVLKEETTNTVTSVTQAGAVTLSASKTEWTNQDVIVTGSTTTGYIVQLSTTESFPNNANEVKSVTVSKNQTVYARLIDSTMQYNGAAATYKVDKIDKEKPTGTMSATSSISEITVTVNANDVAPTNTNGCSGIKGYYYSIDNGANYTNITTSNTYKFSNLAPGTAYNIKVKVEDNAGNVLELSTNKSTLNVTLSLASTSGTVVDGASKTIQVSGSNYGTLSATSSNTSVATASISGTTLTVKGTITSGTNNATITVTGSAGGSATYIVTAHKHTGSSSSGGGCYTKSSTSSYNYTCSGCVSNGTYYCSGCKIESCLEHGEPTSNGHRPCISWSYTCPGHTSYTCYGHTGYTTTYSRECGY